MTSLIVSGFAEKAAALALIRVYVQRVRRFYFYVLAFSVCSCLGVYLQVQIWTKLFCAFFNSMPKITHPSAQLAVTPNPTHPPPSPGPGRVSTRSAVSRKQVVHKLTKAHVLTNGTYGETERRQGRRLSDKQTEGRTESISRMKEMNALNVHCDCL